jgi:hypothetical protein
MTSFAPGLNWIQCCTWISGPPLVPTEELVFALVEASGGRLVPAPREGVSAGAGPRWGLTDREERLYLLIGDERTEVRQLFESTACATKSPNESLTTLLEATRPLATAFIEFVDSLDTISILAIAVVCGIWVEEVTLTSILVPPFLVDNAERAEIGICRTLSTPVSGLTWNRWLRIRKGSTLEQNKGLWLEVDVNTLEHPLPLLDEHKWGQYLADGVSLLKDGFLQLESIKCDR